MDSAVQKTIDTLDPHKRFIFDKFGKSLLGDAYKDNNVQKIEAATQVRLMLRDGLRTEDLSTDERQLLVDVFGEIEGDKKLMRRNGKKRFRDGKK